LHASKHHPLFLLKLCVDENGCCHATHYILSVQRHDQIPEETTKRQISFTYIRVMLTNKKPVVFLQLQVWKGMLNLIRESFRQQHLVIVMFPKPLSINIYLI